MNLCGVARSSYIHLYIPRIGLPIWLQQNKQTNHGNIKGGSDKSGILKILLENHTAQLKIIRFY
jgi:hypothetical protein